MVSEAATEDADPTGSVSPPVPRLRVWWVPAERHSPCSIASRVRALDYHPQRAARSGASRGLGLCEGLVKIAGEMTDGELSAPCWRHC